MVVISCDAATLIGVTHERAALPSISTVQAPHMPMPQPYLVPVRRSLSRRNHSKGIAGSPSCENGSPLIVTGSGTGLPGFAGAGEGGGVAPAGGSGGFDMRLSVRRIALVHSRIDRARMGTTRGANGRSEPFR